MFFLKSLVMFCFFVAALSGCHQKLSAQKPTEQSEVGIANYLRINRQLIKVTRDSVQGSNFLFKVAGAPGAVSLGDLDSSKVRVSLQFADVAGGGTNGIAAVTPDGSFEGSLLGTGSSQIKVKLTNAEGGAIGNEADVSATLQSGTKYDFVARVKTVDYPYTQVLGSSSYNFTAGTTFGFTSLPFGAMSGFRSGNFAPTDPEADFIAFVQGDFAVLLPNGNYHVKLAWGSTGAVSNRAELRIEGVLLEEKLATAPYVHGSFSGYDVSVSDGRLDIGLFSFSSDPGAYIDWLEILPR